VCEKTLCDVATPVLRILGFIEADASTRIIHYTVHMDRIRQAVIAYKQDVTSLITLLRQSVKATLETVLKSPLQHKNQFQCSLEPVLMIFRASSKVKRGRKPKPEDEREAQSGGIENKRESIGIDTGDSKENTSVTVVTDAAPFRPYAEGHAAIQIKSGDVSFPMTLDDLEAAATRLLTAAAQDIQPPKISTPVIPSVDTVSHIVKATRKEAAPPTTEQPHLITTKAALQDALPQSATSPPTRETRKRGKVKIPPTPEEIALQERCRGLQAQVNEWRGYGLTKGGAIINEHKCVRALCEQYTDEQVRHIREYLFTTHWRWSKPDNRYTIGACTILE